jgi:hypothetical protein
MPASQRELLRKLIEDYGFRYLKSEESFYKTHKISRSDFLTKLERSQSAEEREQLIISLFEDDSKEGRRGVLDLERASRIIQKKLDDKERFIKFAEKFGGESIKEYKGIGFGSLKDLV